MSDTCHSGCCGRLLAIAFALGFAPTGAAALDVWDAVVVHRFDATEAVQGVAVEPDASPGAAFFAIANSAIGKYDKRTGEKLGEWRSSEDLPLTHLNSGLVRDGKLYCAHSNFPQWPETSSVEIFDAHTLKHIESHSFGVYEGSLTWTDWRENDDLPEDGAWWACFAHYSERVNNNPRALPSSYTTVVKFDREWRRIGGWVFPPSVIERFEPHSSSGGGWSPDGLLAVTGHDRPEIYLLALPHSGSILRHVATVRAPVTGQAIAWDRSIPGVLYGIDRTKRQVVVCRVEPERYGKGAASGPAHTNPLRGQGLARGSGCPSRRFRVCL